MSCRAVGILAGIFDLRRKHPLGRMVAYSRVGPPGAPWALTGHEMPRRTEAALDATLLPAGLRGGGGDVYCLAWSLWSLRLMMSRWIWLVPSKICRTLASRM